MGVRVQLELSDEEDRIVEVYRIEHKKKNNEDAIKEIIRHYKGLEEHKEKNKTSWLKNL
ncbi:MAG: hypothetical protein ABSB38_02165 [Dehalococcoidia bacterium]|jgi:hypothetical protein